MAEPIQTIQTIATPAPKEKNFAETYGFWMAQLILFFWFISDCDLKTGQLLNGTGACVTQNKVILEFLFLAGWVIFLRVAKRYLDDSPKSKKITIKPFNSEKEIPELRKRVLREYGINFFPIRYITEDEFGRVSSENPHAVHFYGEYQEPNGVWFPLQFKLSLLWREIYKFEPKHSHVETTTHSWSNARKGQESYLSPFSTHQTHVSFEKPTEKKGDGDEEENEED